MPRQFKLLATHYIDNRLLPAGTIIGEGTDVPFLFPDGQIQHPSDQMEGLDESAQAEVDAVRARGFMPIESLPVTIDQEAPTIVIPVPAEENSDIPVTPPLTPKGGKK